MTNSPARSGRVAASPSRGQASPTRTTWGRYSVGGTTHPLSNSPGGVHNLTSPSGQKSDNYSDLLSLVSAQQSRLQSQHAEIKHVRYREILFNFYSNLLQCDNELKYWVDGSRGAENADYVAASQLDAVLSEVRRLEEAAVQNDEEMLSIEEKRWETEHSWSNSNVEKLIEL